MRFVGSHLMEALSLRMDSLMMTMSMLVLRSSTAVGDEGEIKWSYNDLQSVVRIGDRA